MKTSFKYRLILSCLLLISFSMSAGIIEVPDDKPTIALAISEANDNDTILIAPGTYNEHLSWDNKNIVLGSWFLTTGDSTYIDQTIIDGTGNGRIMNITYVEGVSGLFGLTLTNGKSPEGAAIYLLGSKIRMEHLRIKGNQASGADRANGAAIVAGNTKIFANHVIIDSNTAICANDNSLGGGIYSRNSELYFSNSTISNNTADLGGGIFQVYGLIEIDNVRFENNYTAYPGGAIAMFDNAKLDAVNSVFSGNSGAGSAFYGSETQTISFVNCLFKNNSSTVLDVRKLLLRLTNCTFIDNGGPYTLWALNNTVLHSMNNIFWNNNDYELNLSNSNNEAFIGYCALTNGEEGIEGDGPFDIFGPLWDMDPLFEEEGSAELSDYSPYIGAGLDSLHVFPFIRAPLFDMDNNARPMPAGSMPDLGIFENELGSPLLNIPEIKTETIKLFPNPARGYFIIDELPGQKVEFIKIYNQRGELLIKLQQKELAFPLKMDEELLNTSGLIFVEVSSNGKIIRKKLLLL